MIPVISISLKLLGLIKKIPPTFIVSKLTEDMVNLERQGLDTTLFTDEIIIDTFRKLEEGVISKESVILIFEKIMKKEAGKCRTGHRSTWNIFTHYSRVGRDNFQSFGREHDNNYGEADGFSWDVDGQEYGSPPRQS